MDADTLTVMAGLWVGACAAMGLTTRDETERIYLLAAAGVPAAIAGAFWAWSIQQGIPEPNLVFGWIAAGVGAIGGWAYQDTRNKRARPNG